MFYIVGEDLSGEAGKLDSQVLGSVDAPNEKQAHRAAEQRWPGLAHRIYKMPKRKTTPRDNDSPDSDS